MKAKLIKREDGYELLTQGFLKGSTNHELIDSLNVEEGNIRYKLSLKNCQVIELGYDLDELAHHNSLSYTWLEFNERDKTLISKYGIEAFKAGFQKALELMSDKKFSEEDVIKAIEIARKGSMQEQHNGYGRPTELRFVLDNLSSDEIIQSLQQNEWNVEVETVPALSNNGNVYYGDIPKLDTDGCLILKRIWKEN